MAANNKISATMTERQRDAIVAERRAQVSGWYLQCKTQREIAKLVGFDLATVCRDLKALQAQWLEAGLMNIDAKIALELASIDHVEREAWEQWQASKGVAYKQVKHSVPGKRGEAEALEKAIRTQEQRLGDPRYLDIALKCRDRRIKLLGLDAPTRIAPVDPDGVTPYNMQVGIVRVPAKETIEEWEQMVKQQLPM